MSFNFGGIGGGIGPIKNTQLGGVKPNQQQQVANTGINFGAPSADTVSFGLSAKLGTPQQKSNVDFSAISKMSLKEAEGKLNTTTFAGLQALSQFG